MLKTPLRGHRNELAVLKTISFLFSSSEAVIPFPLEDAVLEGFNFCMFVLLFICVISFFKESESS